MSGFKTYKELVKFLKEVAILKERTHKAILARVRGSGVCYYCNILINPDNFSVDHRTPRSRGGSNEEENLVLSCQSCNSSKGKKTWEEYGEWLAGRVLK